MSGRSSKNGEEDAGTYVSQQLDSFGWGRFQYRLLAVSCVISLADGIGSTLLVMLPATVRCSMLLTSYEEALLTSIPMIGAAGGGLVLGYFGDTIGRKVVLHVVIGWTAFFTLISVASPTFSWLLLLRTLIGFGLGGKGLRQSLMLEMTPTPNRAQAFMAVSFSWTVGNMAAVSLIAMSLNTVGIHDAWKLTTGLSSLPLFVGFATLFFVPESARFLYSSKQKKKANQVLQQVASENGRRRQFHWSDCLGYGSEEDLTLSLSPIQQMLVEKEDAAEESWWACESFTKPLRAAIFIVIAGTAGSLIFLASGLLSEELLLWRKMTQSNISSTSNHATALGRGQSTPTTRDFMYCRGGLDVNPIHGTCQHLSGEDYYWVMLVFSAELPAMLALHVLADGLGRRISLTTCYMLAGICYGLLASCLQSFGLIVTVLTLARVGGVLILKLSTLYAVEVVPTHSRTRHLGIATFLFRLTGSIVPPIAILLLRHSISASLLSVSAIGVTAAFVVFCIVTETRHRPMKDIWK